MNAPDPTDPKWRQDHAAEDCQYEQCDFCGCCAHGKTISEGCKVERAPADMPCKNYYCGLRGPDVNVFLLADVWPILAAVAVLTIAFLAICAALHKPPTPPRIPTDVDLQQAVNTTRSITYGHGKGRA